MRYVLKWRYGSDPEFRWFIRDIRDDGVFYGEVMRTTASGGEFRSVDGTLSEEECLTLKAHIEKMQPGREDDPAKNWTGLLAEGPVDHPKILLKYAPGDEHASQDAAEFLALVEILRPHMDAVRW
jgi:hypothetical protein